MQLRIGTVGSPELLTGPLDARRRRLARIADGGLDHVFVADHVSFFGGSGMDGLINAATLAALHPTLEVCVGVYLLALRHPLPVARQIASLCESAPGRLLMGIGVGGEDRHEIEVCGVDPRSRGRRTDESLALVRDLLAGDEVTRAGEFFPVESARIRPLPSTPVLFQVGGRSDAALRRAGRLSEGWLGVWCSPRRFGEALEVVETHAADAGRGDVAWRHGLQVWTGIGATRSAARERVAERMQRMYRLPFERFERWTPYGRARDVGEALAPYAAAGCRHFNVMPVAGSEDEAIDAAIEIAEVLRKAAA